MSEREDESRVIREAQAGNLAAFERLIRNYDRQVLRLARSLVGTAEEAEDVYQEVFVRVYRNLSRFRFESQFSTWLYRIVVNYCFNHNRKRKHRGRWVPLDGSPDEEGESWERTVKGQATDPEAVALNRELGQALEVAVGQLSEKQRAVFVLRHYEGYQLKDIAKILRCSEGTVKNHLFRATQKMQRLLQEFVQP